MAALDSIRRKIQEKARLAVVETDNVGYWKTVNNVQSFYLQGRPKKYVRTGQLGSSARHTGATGSGNRYQTKIYLDLGAVHYDVPNPLFDLDGTGRFSHYTTEEVFDAAENGHSGVLGRSGFWKKSEKEIKEAFDSAMSKRFH